MALRLTFQHGCWRIQMNKKVFAGLLLLLVFVCGIGVTNAQRRIDRHERRELRLDRREIRADRREIRRDFRLHDRRELRTDLRDLRHDRREFRRDLRRARRD